MELLYRCTDEKCERISVDGRMMVMVPRVEKVEACCRSIFREIPFTWEGNIVHVSSCVADFSRSLFLFLFLFRFV